ncbi:type VI secretion protein [Oscillibacter sp.]|uniref:VirB4 family type IV secretion system protein n=1 Tax=Oscillibacter sp. TaxID=1945593 RepID=UPI0028AA36C3|nr:type VI secretion protein [Oscillibacter sp.]
MKRKNKKPVPEVAEQPRPKEFADLIAPSVIHFEMEHFIRGNCFCCVWALRGYPACTDQQALLRFLGEQRGVTLHVYTRLVSAAEEDSILHAAANRNRLNHSDTNNVLKSVGALENLKDMEKLAVNMWRDHEPLVHCAVFLELDADSLEELKRLQAEVSAKLTRCKLDVDHMNLKQEDGFRCANPAGDNVLNTQFERVLPVTSVANLFPYHFSGKTDPHGFCIGRDKYGSNVIVDFSKREEDKTNDSVLILGNSGEGKSFLVKLLICNRLEEGKSILSLDAEHEQMELCEQLGGCFMDVMSGQYFINVLEPKCWNADGDAAEADAPAAFRQRTKLSQHISFLRDFFRAYKQFDDPHLDVLELMLCKLYQQWGITDLTDFSKITPADYPIPSDLYDCMERAYQDYGQEEQPLYPAELLRDVLLGLHSMCKGADARYFNGHTNVTTSRFLVFGVKDLLNAAQNVRNAMLFNILSLLSDRLLTVGNTVAVLDELYVWLSNPVAVEYIRNCLKRVRKKESSLMMSSQNLEDFDQPSVREMTRPLFAIPTHQFLFYGGAVDQRFYMENLRLEKSEFELIRRPQNGVCLYKCGNERYLLKVQAPPFKQKLFGTAGGR